jgi:F420-dependent oxidoreductase-like protein
MQFGLQVNPYLPGTTGNPWDSVAAVARAADETSLDSLWLYDHFLYEGGYGAHPIPEPVMECFTMLGAIAAITRRIRLGELVLGVPYRNPAMTAKAATTLDLISHGRSILGLGAGWHRREYEAYGWGTFEDVPVRMRRLEEAVRAMLCLWTERPSTFKGTFYTLDHVEDLPAPVQQPHPPLLIGGSGTRVTLRLVAQYAQFCNVSGEPETVGQLFGTLREHCDRVGRQYDQITRSIYTTILVGRDESEVSAKRERLGSFLPRRSLVGTPDQLIDKLGEYASVGCQYVIFRTPDWIDVEPIQMFSERVIPALAAA